MRAALLFVALALTLASCSHEQTGVVTHRARNGRPDQWVYHLDGGDYKIAIDTNGDGHPDVIKTFKAQQLVEVETDRNFDGHVDLVQVYSHGVLVREIHDDDYDGRPEVIKTFRPNDGTLAMVERDPDERGAIDIMEFYDNSGRLTRREERGHKSR
jgi:hypothetical protein